MGIEAATYLADLQPTNPTSTDLRSQGDDHLRLIKQVLQTTFPGASRTNPVGTTLAKTADYSIVKNDGNSVIYVDTTAATVNLTLPTLAALDAGWRVAIIKTNSGTNPIFVKPPSGTINSGGTAGLSACRRSIPGAKCWAIWDGSGFFVTRATPLPVGTVIPIYRSALPTGYEWPNGQTFASVATNYPEYNAAVGSGVTPDLRGRAAVGLDNMGGAAGRIGTIVGATLGSAGGTETVALTIAQLPAHAHTGTTNTESQAFNHNYTAPTSPVNVGGFAPGGVIVTVVQGNTAATTGNQNQNHTHSFTTDNAGSGSAHSNMQPSVVLGMALLVE